jgi:hypothetical protein
MNQMTEVQCRLKETTILERPMKEIDSNRAIKDTFKVVLDTFTLSQGYKCTCELMLMR